MQTTELSPTLATMLGNVVRQGNVFKERLFEMHITGYYVPFPTNLELLLLLTKDLIQYISLSHALFFNRV